MARPAASGTATRVTDRGSRKGRTGAVTASNEVSSTTKPSHQYAGVTKGLAVRGRSTRLAATAAGMARLLNTASVANAPCTGGEKFASCTSRNHSHACSAPVTAVTTPSVPMMEPSSDRRARAFMAALSQRELAADRHVVAVLGVGHQRAEARGERA